MKHKPVLHISLAFLLMVTLNRLEAADSRKTKSKFSYTDIEKYIEMKSKSNQESSSVDKNKHLRPILNSTGSINWFVGTNDERAKKPNRLSNCRPLVKVFKLNISGTCEPIDYKTVECSGYCSSRSYLWNGYETSDVACCSIVKVHQEKIKLYCLAPVEFNVLADEIFKSWAGSQSLSLQGSHLYELFRTNAASPPVWTAHYELIGDRLYSGFYSISMAYNATCRCVLIN